MDFSQRIKALRAEVEALKTVKRKNSITLATITKTATCAGQIYKDQNGLLYVRYSGAVKIIPKGENPIIYSVALAPYAERKRDARAFNWLFNDDEVGVVVTPFTNSADSSMANNSTKNIALTVHITATDDFTTQSSQILNDDTGL